MSGADTALQRAHDGTSLSLSADLYVHAPGCADAVDVGETSYTMVLADDLNADGKLDLLVTTMNGNVYVFSSPAPYHPLKSWTSQVRRASDLHTTHCAAVGEPYAVRSAALPKEFMHIAVT